MSCTGAFARGVAALVALTALVAGIPLALVVEVGWPLPTRVPTWEGIGEAIRTGRIADATIIKTFTVLLWLAWANLTAGLAIEVAGMIRGRQPRALRGLRPAQHLAANLLATAALLFSTLNRPVAPSVELAADLRLAVAAAVHTHHTAGLLAPAMERVGVVGQLDGQASPDADAAEAGPQASEAALYRVQRRDTLWDIAERLLGDPHRWREIHDLNVGRPQPDGRALQRGSDEIHPGWLLSIPAPEDSPVAPGSAQTGDTVIVQRGDTLWDLAAQHLDDPLRWPDLYDANRDRPQPDGRRLTDPDLIHPGWVLRLPDASAPQAPLRERPAGRPDERPEAPAPDTSDASAPEPAVSPSEHDTEAGSHELPEEPPAPSSNHDEPTLDRAGTVDEQGPAGRDAPIVALPSGAVVGAALAAAIGSCLAAARLHRRRRRIPGEPGPGIAHDDATPASVRRLRRAHLDLATAQPASGAPDTGADAEHAPRLPPYILEIGHRDGQAMNIDLRRCGALCLTGSGARDAARAIALEWLAREPRNSTRHLLVAYRSLLGDTSAALEPVPDVDVGSLDDALTRAEVELIRRTRLFDEAGAADYESFTAARPEEPLPRLLIVATVPEHQREARLEAVATLGQRLGIATLLLSHVHGWPTISINDEHEVIEASKSLQSVGLLGTRVFTVSEEDTSDLVRVIAVAYGAVTDDEPEGATAIETVTADSHSGTGPDPKPVEVSVLGPVTITAGGQQIKTGLRTKARELLVYLSLHPRGVTLDAAVDTLWPDADLVRGTERFRTVLGNLRSTLRQATGLEEATFIERAGEHYKIDAELIACDLWRLQAALAEAQTASRDEAMEPLTRVVDDYRGELAEGAFYEWVEPAREDMRRRAIDALSRLAELREESGNLDGSIDALERAIQYDPYAEELYRRTMRVQAALQRPDALHRTFRLLRSRLEELDLEPDEATEMLLHSGSFSVPDRSGGESV